MLPVQVPGKRPASLCRREQSRKKAGHVPCIIFKLREALAQKCFLSANHRKIDGEEEKNNSRNDPPASRGHREPERQNQRTEVERIARVGIRASGGKLL